MQLILYRTKRIPTTQLVCGVSAGKKETGCMPNALRALAAYGYIAALAASQHGCKTNALLPLAASRMHCSIQTNYRYMTARRIHCSHWLQADMAASLIT
jgi:hypothetical protein